MSNEIVNGWGAIGEEEKGNTGGGNERKIDFLKIPFGDTKVRILDAVPFSYKEWWSPKANEGKGSSIPYKGADDLLEAENRDFMKKIFDEADAKGLKDKARKDFLRDEGYKKAPWGKVKQKHIIHVLDRATGEIKLLDAGNGIFNALKKFALNSDYGDLRFYDVTITKTDTKGKGNFFDIEYSVMPSPNKGSITDAERKLYEEKKEDLVKLKSFEDVTPEQAYAIAKGGSWKDILGNGSDSAEESKEKANTEDLPPQEDKAPSEPVGKDEEVNKGEALSPEELENMEF
ncbi:hypothetical protein BpsS36_00030 [Bacillus phage vB_BpsS-36]|uniref:Uncharacterized protein n=1 Tax=Bacillus phage vB_BpsS-36 TaxID=2419622 RepID=A0A3G3BX68_9CAUD|nr:hypothetical protein BpsS36_00030 [Bacillus phage vB_BpsS-36]